MMLGMGLVFVFLALVILFVQGIAKLIQWHEATPAEGKSGGLEGDDGGRVAAAIAVALHERNQG